MGNSMSWIFAPAAFDAIRQDRSYRSEEEEPTLTELEALEIACETAEFGKLDFFYQNVAKTLDDLGFEIREKK